MGVTDATLRPPLAWRVGKGTDYDSELGRPQETGSYSRAEAVLETQGLCYTGTPHPPAWGALTEKTGVQSQQVTFAPLQGQE